MEIWGNYIPELTSLSDNCKFHIIDTRKLKLGEKFKSN